MKIKNGFVLRKFADKIVAVADVIRLISATPL